MQRCTASFSMAGDGTVAAAAVLACAARRACACIPAAHPACALEPGPAPSSPDRHNPLTGCRRRRAWRPRQLASATHLSGRWTAGSCGACWAAPTTHAAQFSPSRCCPPAAWPSRPASACACCICHSGALQLTAATPPGRDVLRCAHHCCIPRSPALLRHRRARAALMLRTGRRCWNECTCAGQRRRATARACWTGSQAGGGQGAADAAWDI